MNETDNDLNWMQWSQQEMDEARRRHAEEKERYWKESDSRWIKLMRHIASTRHTGERNDSNRK